MRHPTHFHVPEGKKVDQGRYAIRDVR